LIDDAIANKRSRRGRRILSWRKAAQWDEERIRRFEEVQRRKREWIPFAEIAEWYSDLRGPVSPEKAADLREQALSMLKSDLLARLFEEGGRSRVLFRYPGVDFTRGKMTRQRLQEAIDDDPNVEHVRLLLSHCWLPRDLFERWCAWHHLPKSPPRFEPTKGKHVTQSSGESEAPSPATRRPQHERARRALTALFGSEVPDAATLPSKRLADKVNKWLEDHQQPPVGQRTVQRAAGRK
jgi:hypothetical protein